MAKAKKSAVVATADFVETIVELDATEALDADYGDYAKEVIDDRAVPRAADGLKPVHRRILWDMFGQRLFPDRPFVKTARVTGDTMALYHPHGDASIADALARCLIFTATTAHLISAPPQPAIRNADWVGQACCCLAISNRAPCP